ncbi:hypothetical protein [Streptomyces sp. WAC00469]|nr:hypothetical protein [Streptomyces sp. WAC00469]
MEATRTEPQAGPLGDPLHGTFANPCRACTALSAHFGIRIVDTTDDSR